MKIGAAVINEIIMRTHIYIPIWNSRGGFSGYLAGEVLSSDKKRDHAASLVNVLPHEVTWKSFGI